MRRGLLVFLVLAFHLPSLSRTVIVTGWDVCTATLDEILESADLFAATPVDGIAFNLRVADKKGKSHASGHPAESPFVWTREMLAGDVPKLRKMVSHKGLTESVVGVGAVRPFADRVRRGPAAAFQIVAKILFSFGHAQEKDMTARPAFAAARPPAAPSSGREKRPRLT